MKIHLYGIEFILLRNNQWYKVTWFFYTGKVHFTIKQIYFLFYCIKQINSYENIINDILDRSSRFNVSYFY